jgi:hypothetical protein
MVFKTAVSRRGLHTDEMNEPWGVGYSLAEASRASRVGLGEMPTEDQHLTMVVQVVVQKGPGDAPEPPQTPRNVLNFTTTYAGLSRFVIGTSIMKRSRRRGLDC